MSVYLNHNCTKVNKGLAIFFIPFCRHWIWRMNIWTPPHPHVTGSNLDLSETGPRRHVWCRVWIKAVSRPPIVSNPYCCTLHKQREKIWPCYTYREYKNATAAENGGSFNQRGGVMGWCETEMSFVQGGKCPPWQSGFVLLLRKPWLWGIWLRFKCKGARLRAQSRPLMVDCNWMEYAM